MPVLSAYCVGAGHPQHRANHTLRLYVLRPPVLFCGGNLVPVSGYPLLGGTLTLHGGVNNEITRLKIRLPSRAYTSATYSSPGLRSSSIGVPKAKRTAGMIPSTVVRLFYGCSYTFHLSGDNSRDRYKGLFYGCSYNRFHLSGDDSRDRYIKGS